MGAGGATLSGLLPSLDATSAVDGDQTHSSPSAENITSSLSLVHQREWHIGDSDESTHVLGNGHALIHELGPNITHFRAPWISSPRLLTMWLIAPQEIRTISSRERGTNIWHHKLYLGSDAVGEIVDFLEDGEPCLRRMVYSKAQLTFAVRAPRLVDYSDRYRNCGSLLGQWPLGTDIFFDFQTSNYYTVQLVFPKSTHIYANERVIPPNRYSFLFGDLPGHETRLQLAAGRNEIVIGADAGH